MPNQPRPSAEVGVPKPVTVEQLQPSTLLQTQTQDMARAHEESLARMRSAAGHVGGGRDPLSRHYRLPSGGLWYPEGHGGSIFIAPTRGEQEEVLAGMGEGAAASAALRHVAEQVVDFNGIGLPDILVLDWPAVLLHLLAYSAGDDRVFLAPSCPRPRGCGKPSDQTRTLGEMECVELRFAGPGEESTWPVPEPSDPDLAILEEIMGGGTMGTVAAVVSQDGAREPFQTDPLEPLEWNGPALPGTGDRVSWRHLRMKDMVVAEEFAQRTGSAAVQAGSKLNNILLALQITSVNGNKTGLLQAYAWVKETPSPLLSDLRRQMERRSFSYNMRPRFKCPHCGHSFRTDLPLDGSLFRRGRS